ncbi:MAG TPA: hydrogenase 4 subunit B [Blastocatellia bacterium]|nr:hydrogenase 4 subunit B [Blastocatellia bacterium]
MTVDNDLMLKLLAAMLASFGTGAAGALLSARWPRVSRIVGHSFAFLGGCAALALGLSGLNGATLGIRIEQILPLGGVTLGIDRLSGLFLVVIAAATIPSALYAIGYTREYEGRHSLAAMGLGLNLFLAALVLVVMARNVLTFLALWEGMSLASYFLVMTESDDRDTERVGWLYFVMMHAGFACLLIGFLLLSRAAGSMEFSGWAAGAASITPAMRNLIFVLLGLGFGSKAGVIPLHIWLPQAHPTAPSHVSALMSGVMIKLGIYGLLRVGFDWLGAGPSWWGGALLMVGAVSAVLGVLYAMVTHDLKRLLAYSSVENVGIVLLGVGAAMLFHSYHLPALAALALVASLYHTLNHTVFKSLLFMGAGAVVYATHTRNMEEMGGLIRRMPQTAAFFLVGSLAIAAMPPFNGFVSEWLTFQSLLLSFQIPDRAINLIFVFSVAALALTSGLAAACFIKAFGISFLALPRSDRSKRAREVGFTMRAAMGLLAIACLALGVATPAILRVLSAITSELVGSEPALRFNWNGIVANDSFATVSPLWIATALAALLVSIPVALRVLRSNKSLRYYESWGCGRAMQTARFEYTATSFANPFKRVFSVLYRPVKELAIEFHPQSRFFVRTISYSNEARSVFDDLITGPLTRVLRSFAERVRIVQSGNIHIYLLYILAALVALLISTR